MAKKTESNAPEVAHPLDGLVVSGVVSTRFVGNSDAWLAPYFTFDLLENDSMLVTRAPSKDYTGEPECFLLSAGTWLATMKRKEV